MTVEAIEQNEALTRRWFPALNEVPEASARLICFPFAGGSAAAFAQWPRGLLTEVEVRALQLPARGSRLAEAPVDRLDLLMPVMQQALAPLCDRPLFFFGHSNGALMAYELAAAMQRAAGGRKMPYLMHTIISAKPAPHIPRESLRCEMTDEDLIAELHQFGGTPPELLAHREFMQMMLPAIRADFALSERYRVPAEKTVINCPASIWWGERDDLVLVEEVAAWREYFSAVVGQRGFAGGHFYLHDVRVQTLQALNEIIADYLV